MNGSCESIMSRGVVSLSRRSLMGPLSTHQIDLTRHFSHAFGVTHTRATTWEGEQRVCEGHELDPVTVVMFSGDEQ